MTRRARATLFAAAMSLSVHVGVALLLPHARDLADLAPHREALDLDVVVEGPRSSAAPASRGEPARLWPGGYDAPQNIDARDPGQGGDAAGAQAGILLLPRAEAITLGDAPMNALGLGQTQRIRTARDRASWEDRRATPNPADEPFLASGVGRHRERRPVAAVDPRSGARTAPPAASEGSNVETPMPPAIAAETNHAIGAARAVRTAAPRRAGTDASSPGRGIVRGVGERESERAPVAHGRPAVDEGRAATTTEERSERVRDDVDAELLAAQMMQSVLESTERLGRTRDEGRGGAHALGAPGVGGGRREGGRARAYGPGRGAFAALDTGDARYRRWLVDLRRRIENALVFPRARQLSMDQGTSVVRFDVRRDGTLRSEPRVIRSSGFADLDGAALAAVRSTAPFSPIPGDVWPDRDTVRVDMPIEFSNPMVR